MPSFQCQRVVQAAPEAVFAAMSDLRGVPGRIPSILRLELLTEGPVRKGTRFRETRRMFGREASEVLEVVEFDPPRRMAFGCDSCGCRYRTEYRMRAVPGAQAGRGATELEMEFQAEGLNWIGRLMGKLMQPMLKKVGAECAKDLEALAGSVEREAAR